GEDRYFRERARIEQGHTKYRDKLREEGKLFVRDRLKLLLDPGSEFQEDWLFARSNEPDTPADGVVTGVGKVGGRPVCVMANDYTVKAGSCTARSPAAATCSRRRTRTRSRWPGGISPTCRSRSANCRRPPRPPSPSRVGRSTRSCPTTSGSTSTCTRSSTA